MVSLPKTLVLAEDNNNVNENFATYYDYEEDCEVKLLVLDNEERGRRAASSTGYFEVYKDGVFSHTIVIDIVTDYMQFLYADGKVITGKVSDYVLIEDFIDTTNSTIAGDNLISNNLLVTRSIDVVDTAQETVNERTGVQTTLGTISYGGFEAMGCRGGYWYAPSTYGYLQRKLSAYSVSYSKRFTVSTGTTASTFAAVIYQALQSTSWKDVLISAIESAVFAVFGSAIDSGKSAEYQIRTYRWDYRVRLNSDTGNIIGTDYRTKTYTRVYDSATGAVSYQYNGNSCDDGFPLSNSEMIKAKIDKYLEP